MNQRRSSRGGSKPPSEVAADPCGARNKEDHARQLLVHLLTSTVGMSKSSTFDQFGP